MIGEHYTETVIIREDSSLHARDYDPDTGEASCIKQQLGTFKTPEDAELFGFVLTDPRLMLLSASGKLTQEVWDKITEAMRNKK